MAIKVSHSAITINQFNMVGIEKNDLLFAVGPAGSGKIHSSSFSSKSFKR